MTAKAPTAGQILAAQVRAAREAYDRKHRKPVTGGWEMPSREQVYKHLSKKFNLTSWELSFFFTYSRSCTHEWNEGACHLCPVPSIFGP